MNEKRIIFYLFSTFKKKLNKLLKKKNIFIEKLGDFSPHFGPDFQHSVVQMNDKILYGDIEVHSKAIDWYKHKHFINHAYDHVVLHVTSEKGSGEIPIETANGNSVTTINLDVEAVLGVLNATSEILLHSQDFYKLLPCWEIQKKKNFNLDSLRKKLIKLGQFRFLKKIQWVRKYIDYENRDFDFYFLYLQFFIGKRESEVASKIRVYLKEHSLKKTIKFIETVYKFKNKNNPCRPSNSIKSRLKLLIYFLKEKVKIDLVADLEKIAMEHPNSIFKMFRFYFKKKMAIPDFTTSMIIINIIFPLLWIRNKDLRYSILSNLYSISGKEKNHKVRRFMLNFPREKFSEIEQQGMIYIYDYYCSKSCIGCPVLEFNTMRIHNGLLEKPNLLLSTK